MRLIILLLSGFISFAAYSEEPKGALHMANPASEFCIFQGGKLTIIDSEEGAIGYCEFPNGAVCEEWALFHGRCSVQDSDDSES